MNESKSNSDNSRNDKLHKDNPSHLDFADKDVVYCKTITFQYPMVVQKSYGNEKRLFVPPPMIKFEGNGWKSDSIKNVELWVISNKNHNEIFRPERYNKYFGFKNVYTSQTGKFKVLRLQVKIEDKYTNLVSTVQTQSIKIISKPSRQISTARDEDLVVHAGDKVCFFNRLRSQNASTKYLNVKFPHFEAIATDWGLFSIDLISTLRNNQNVNGKYDDLSIGKNSNLLYDDSDNGIKIFFGDLVKLTCTRTGLCLPPLIIQKIEKKLISTPRESVKTHQRVAFLDASLSNNYLCTQNDKIFFCDKTIAMGAQTGLDDSCIWTITSVKHEMFSLSETYAKNPREFKTELVFPMIYNFKIKHLISGKMMDIIGENFKSGMSVLFHTLKVRTLFISAKNILCVIPSASKILNLGLKNKEPIVMHLMNEDNVIFPGLFILHLK